MSIRVAINGFGRIGRLFLRALIERDVKGITVVAINDLVDPDNLAYLLKYDTVHGRAPFAVEWTESALTAAGHSIAVFNEADPENLPWERLGVAYVVDSTGRFTKEEELRKHLKAGAKRVLLSAPPRDDMPVYVMGVNHKEYNPKKDFILSNASCTTNCLAPLAKLLDAEYGIVEGLMTTIHAMTASQPTVDSPSKKDFRGGRAASHNAIPASTGAAKAVALCLPQLKGKLTGMAFRIPTIDVSAVDLTVKLAKETSYTEICARIKDAAAREMNGIIEYCDDEVVSSDFIGCRASCIFDAKAGIALNSTFYKLIAWYDNEVGYANRMVDLICHMAKQEN